MINYFITVASAIWKIRYSGWFRKLKCCQKEWHRYYAVNTKHFWLLLAHYNFDFILNYRGLYHFTIFFNSYRNCDTKLGIFRDSDDIPLCFADAEDWEMSSCSALVELWPGDLIKVKVINENACVHSNGKRITGFLGYQVKQFWS